MNNRQLNDPIYQMEHWGYYLLPEVHPHFPGYTGLLVAIRAQPTRQHYDPESVRLEWFNSAGVPEMVTLGLQTPIHRARHVCPGPIVLNDRRDKQENFFSFGGTVESTATANEIVFVIRSSAPLLWLTRDGDTDTDQLAAEFGRLVAQVRAEEGERDEVFFRRLGGADPKALYVASSYTLMTEYDQSPELRECSPRLENMLHEEEGWLKAAGEWPPVPTTLHLLLYPDTGPKTNGNKPR